MISRAEHHLSTSPTLALLLRALIRYGCTLCLLPVTSIRCEEIAACVDARAYARTGLRDLEAFVRERA